MTLQERLRQMAKFHDSRECVGGQRHLTWSAESAEAADRIDALEAALDEIHGAAYAMSRGINGGVTTMCVPIGAWDNAMKARNAK